VWTKSKNNSKIKSKKREEKRRASESSPLLILGENMARVMKTVYFH
jgi:hypothetical protein